MKNNKFSFTLVLSGLILCIAVLPTLTANYAVSARQAIPTAAPISPVPIWTGTFTVRADLPFVWLRVAPQSSASVVATAYPNQLLTAATSPDGLTQVSDGTQWWGYVTVPGGAIAGWVEVKSLQPGPTPTSTPTAAPEIVAPWGISTAVRVRATVTFLWLRQRPASDATVLYQVPAGSVMVTVAPPQSDGLQNWWPVLDVQSGVMGWAEQNSLEPASIGVDIAHATLTPVPTVQSWQPGNKVRVRDSVTVGLVRVAPNSRAQVVARVVRGNILDVVGTSLFGDGKWWWLVKARGTNVTGWIEESSLEIAPSDA